MTEVELSVVVPIYDEEAVLPELRRRLDTALDLVNVASEIVLVDDGSRDRSRALLEEWAAVSPRVRLVELARNFGHAAACTAGLDAAAGRAVVLMDGDLQDPPELIGDLLATAFGCEIVYAERRSRAKGSAAPIGHGLQPADLDMPGVGIFPSGSPRGEARSCPVRNRFLPGHALVGFRVGASHTIVRTGGARQNNGDCCVTVSTPSSASAGDRCNSPHCSAWPLRRPRHFMRWC